ncbi:glutathione S-transferase T3-like [Salvia hispanica]|uniref:glutathione S-transferase T3-like n=1 Tax=Salvia hispanica TaxID=49212 RepID=UPI002009497F|nr:glutathione S-transferase T3-like [Salvia hispanica]
MSGDGNSSSGGRRRSGGFDLNSFDDWASMYNFLGTGNRWDYPKFSENFLPPERTLPDWPIGGGSGRIGVNAEEEEGDHHDFVGDGGRHPYSEKEMLALYDVWIRVSYDPVVGNQQTHLCFWNKVTEVYNARRAKKTFTRNVKMLRSHWDRCDKDVKKFCAIYRAEEANYQSGASGADILRAALRVFKDDVGKDFKYVEVWSHVHHLERWVGGVESGSGSKRTKHTACGHYSSSDGGEGNTSQEGTPTDDTGGVFFRLEQREKLQKN